MLHALGGHKNEIVDSLLSAQTSYLEALETVTEHITKGQLMIDRCSVNSSSDGSTHEESDKPKYCEETMRNMICQCVLSKLEGTEHLKMIKKLESKIDLHMKGNKKEIKNLFTHMEAAFFKEIPTANFEKLITYEGAVRENSQNILVAQTNILNENISKGLLKLGIHFSLDQTFLENVVFPSHYGFLQNLVTSMQEELRRKVSNLVVPRLEKMFG